MQLSMWLINGTNFLKDKIIFEPMDKFWGFSELVWGAVEVGW
jgi:hypothetical protein